MAKVYFSEYISYISGRVSRKLGSIGNCFYHRPCGNILTRVRFNTTKFSALQLAYQKAFKEGIHQVKKLQKNPSEMTSIRQQFNAQSEYKNFLGYLCSVAINQMHLKTIKITINPNKGGSSLSHAPVHIGQTVTIQVTPENGYVFHKWSNGITENPYTLTVLDDIVLTAEMELPQEI